MPHTPLEEAHPGGLSFDSFMILKPNFNKPALSSEQHVVLLIDRGLTVADKNFAKHILDHVSYYRLSAYFEPLQKEGSPAGDHEFMEDVCFEDIFQLYLFDKRLRSAIIVALEKIEISVRTNLNNYMSKKHGAHWFMDVSVYKNENCYFELEKVLIKEVCANENGGHHNRAVEHYFSKYSSPEYPPGWVCMEIFSFGTISKLYSNLLRPYRGNISKSYNLAPEVFVSWLRALSNLRNLCAHHSRVWNRTFVYTFIKPNTLNITFDENSNKLKNYFVAINYLLTIISSGSNWSKKFLDLVKTECPSEHISHTGFAEGDFN